MLLEHHIGHREDRLGGIEGFDQFGILIAVEPEQAHRGVHRREQAVIVAIERDQLLEVAQQLTTVAVMDEQGGHVS